MRIRIPFNYAVSYRPYRARNMRDAYFASETEVEVREVEPEWAPVALLVARRGGYGNRLLPLANGEPRRVLWFEGRLWAEHGSAEEMKRTLESSGEERLTPFGACQHRRGDEIRGTNAGSRVIDAQTLAKREPRIQQMDDDHGEVMARKLARRAEDVIIVDGVAYEREYEPCIKVRGADERGDEIVAELAFEPTRRRDPFESHYRDVLRNEQDLWGLTQLDEAVAFERRRAGRDLPVELRFDAEVLMPDVLVHATHAEAVLDMAQKALAELARNASALPQAAGAAMFELRDALVETRSDVSPRLLDALAMVADLPEPSRVEVQEAAARAAARPGKTTEWGIKVDSRTELMAKVLADAVPETRRTAERALERWACRQAGISWEEDGLRPSGIRVDEAFSHEVLSLSSARRVGADLGVDLSEMAEAALRGDARLFRVNDDATVIGMGWAQEGDCIAAVLACVRFGTVISAVGRDGGEAPEKAVKAVEAHLAAATEAVPELSRAERLPAASA